VKQRQLKYNIKRGGSPKPGKVNIPGGKWGGKSGSGESRRKQKLKRHKPHSGENKVARQEQERRKEAEKNQCPLRPAVMVQKGGTVFGKNDTGKKTEDKEGWEGSYWATKKEGY